MGLNWKKILTFTFAGGFAGALGNYASEMQAGHHFAFTAAHIIVPAFTSVISTLAALFVKPPQQG